MQRCLWVGLKNEAWMCVMEDDREWIPDGEEGGKAEVIYNQAGRSDLGSVEMMGTGRYGGLEATIG